MDVGGATAFIAVGCYLQAFRLDGQVARPPRFRVLKAPAEGWATLNQRRSVGQTLIRMMKSRERRRLE
jgi:hypothetical protein